MPFSHYISGEIAWLVGNGSWDVRAWRAAMTAVLSDPRLAPDNPMLWDFRRLKFLLKPGDPPVVARTLAMLAPDHRVAVITKRPTTFGDALRLKALTHGQVIAFDADVSRAIRWLRVHQDV